MKKHLSKILLAAFAVMLLSMSVLVGCESTPDSLEGTKWGIESVSYNGQTMDINQYAQAIGVSADEMTIEFKDGKAIAGGGETSAVDYTYENGKVSIMGTEFTVNGNTMEAEQDGAKIVMKRK